MLQYLSKSIYIEVIYNNKKIKIKKNKKIKKYAHIAKLSLKIKRLM